MTRLYQCSQCLQNGHNKATCPTKKKTRSRRNGGVDAVESRYPGIMAKLGKVTDRVIASEYGITGAAVHLIRRKYNIPPCATVKHGPKLRDIETSYPGMFDRLGKDRDSALAAEYGISRERVRQYRLRYNINAVPRAYAFPNRAVRLLGVATDAELARKYNVPVPTIFNMRRKMGIPRASVTSRTNRILEIAKDRLGKESDGKIAQSLGVSPILVCKYRNKHGIAPVRLSPRSAGFTPIDRDRVTQLFRDGCSDIEIAQQVNSTPKTVTLIRNQLGLHRGRRSTIPAEKRAEILRLHREGMNRHAISLAVQIGYTTVCAIVAKNR